ncbi:hypothetical protein A8A01_08745 [Ewingella americana]|uniref:DUF2950 domain-containing protein n=1 Tax=Rahnella victoriana TaxID=1510570 RepID=UPI000BB183CE|nr:DUF2950 domain-containing protein [Rahnella victoriana]PBI81746.1 hypothetical protein A9993_19405 [Rahnella victoriana]PKB90149.1 hypothetical protein A8A01_08745 [Ewingella americana]
MKRLRDFLISTSLLLLPLTGFAQQMFTSPELASQALVKAIQTHDDASMQQLLGDDWRVYLPKKDVDPDEVARFLRDWNISHTIAEHGDTAHLNVGPENWQLPIPMKHTAQGWSFDMVAGAAEIETRTIGRNELSAIQAVSAYADAQHEYQQIAGHYAQRFISTEGQHDGLYWPVKEGEAPSPLGPAFGNDQPGSDYHGYFYRILTAQGENASGGAHSYIENGEMTKGFALIAWPAVYGHTGVTSFMISQQGEVYQQDLGENTDAAANAITAFDPDAKWQKVDDGE